MWRSTTRRTPRSLVGSRAGGRRGRPGVRPRPDLLLRDEVVDVPIQLDGAGDLRAVSVSLRWNPAVVEPVGVSAGDWRSPRANRAVVAPGRTWTPRAGHVAWLAGRHARDRPLPGARDRRSGPRDRSDPRPRRRQSTVSVATAGRRSPTSWGRPPRPSCTRSFESGAAQAVWSTRSRAPPVDLAVYSVDGDACETWFAGPNGGVHRLAWMDRRARDGAPSGVYYVR